MKIPDVVLLTREEEESLGRRVQAWQAASGPEADALAADGIAARNELATANTLLVPWSIIHIVRAEPATIDDDDIQDGNAALLYAAERFDPGRGRFATYATWTIAGFVRTGRRRRRLRERVGGPAWEIHISNAAVPDRKAEPTESPAVLLDACLRAGSLSERERDILLSWYGVGGVRLGLAEIGRRHGVSKQRVEQLRRRAAEMVRAGTLARESLADAVRDHLNAI